MNIYEDFRIEKRRDGTFWVLDKRGSNIVEAGPFPSMDAAQDKWVAWAEAALEDHNVAAILNSSDADALARRWPKPLTR